MYTKLYKIIELCNSCKAVYGLVYFILFYYFFLFGFYGPFKNISLISSRSFIEGGRKPENPEKNHLTIRKQLGFPTYDPSEARTTAVRNLMD